MIYRKLEATTQDREVQTIKPKKILGIWRSAEDFIYSVYCRQGYYAALNFICRAALAAGQAEGEKLLDQIIENKGIPTNGKQ